MHIFSLSSLYTLTKELYPEGIMGDDFIAVTIEGEPLELRLTHEYGSGHDVELLFFRPDTRYARKSLVVYADGQYQEDKEGVIPEFDLLNGEHELSFSNSLFLQVAYQALAEGKVTVMA
jgi:hypothetical protein